MDKSAIKNYAVEARRKLIEAVRQKAYSLYIYEDGTLPPDEALSRLRADGIFLSPEQSNARLRFCNELAALGHTLDNKAAYQHMVEEVAYTWFNRLIALRFMEVNEYLPTGIHILSSREPGRIEPDAVREVERLNYVSQTKVAELRADTAINAAEKLYKHILIAQCNTLSDILPGMFQKANDYTELLLPDALLAKGGIVYDLINGIEEKNFKIRTPQDEAAIINGTLKEEDAPAGQIEIIGWLYQYYISEKKDEVFANLKKNIKINRDTIPAATQLFTPEWIVKYMVENSLGRLWLDSHPNEELRSKWKYYVDEAEQELAVAEQLRDLRSQSPVKRPEDIKLIDPCMGSGHILVYAFEVLFQIYQSEGYSEREIPNLVLQNNLYGLDIDDRAGQLAYFALMMKARGYSRRFFRQENIPQPHVHAIRDSEMIGGAYQYEMGNFLLSKEHQDTLNYLLTAFRDAKEYGSILKLEERDYQGLAEAWKYTASQTAENFNLTLWYSAVEKEIPLLIEQAIMLTQKYDVVVTNPPYMGSSGMGGKLSEYVKDNYPDSKSDMSTVFMEKTLELCNSHGYMAMINIPVWMFLTSYEKLRKKILLSKSIANMLHFGRGVFGSDFGSTSFVIGNNHINGYVASYRRLFMKQGAVDSVEQKERWFFDGVGASQVEQEHFHKISGSPIAYWVSEKFIDAFDYPSVSKIANSCIGMRTGDNDRFLRYWYEINKSKMSLSATSAKQVVDENKKWVPFTKGGEFRRWYGNNEYVVNWEDEGREIKDNTRRVYPQLGDNLGWKISNEQHYFKEGITWTVISSAKTSFRRYYSGHIFSNSGQAVIANEVLHLDYLLGLLNTKVVEQILSIISPTIGFESGYIGKIPVVLSDGIYDKVVAITKNSIALSRTDWDSFETSWDFKTHPLIAFRGNYEEAEPLMVADDLIEGAIVTKWSKTSSPISQVFDAWERHCDWQFDTLKRNEEELNRIFIDIYGLQDELTPEIEDKDVTVRRADRARDVRSFISYTVGCMFGRYSLDEQGLVFAGGQFDMSRYKTYLPEDDNIIPIGSADYFDDDIVVRFIEFVRVVYGDNTLGENLSFIADALYPNGSGSPQERIRRYFLNDFYKDHVKIYQKRPIYWLMDSGKKDGFKALFYLHRYDKYTVARARTDYLHPLQRKYDAEIKRLEMLSGTTDNAREKAVYRKEIDVLLAKIDECRVYDQVVSHIAHLQIELDLDDGVKVNYAKFQGVDVPKDNGKTEMMDLLGRI